MVTFFADLGFGLFFIAVAAVIGIFAYWLWQFSRTMKAVADKDVKFEILEEIYLDKLAMKKGIDLNKEVFERKIIKEITKEKSFKKQVRDNLYEDFFGKDKK